MIELKAEEVLSVPGGKINPNTTNQNSCSPEYSSNLLKHYIKQGSVIGSSIGFLIGIPLGYPGAIIGSLAGSLTGIGVGTFQWWITP